MIRVIQRAVRMSGKSRDILFERFKATPEISRDNFCFHFFHMHYQAFSKGEQNVEILDDIIETLRLMICDDAKMPEIWHRSLTDLFYLFPRYADKYGKRTRRPRK
jgi:hypothetical protein